MSLPRLICIAILSAAAVLAGREAGGLEALELAAYDQGVRWRAGSADPSVHVAVIAIDDTDLTSWGWPVPDRIMDSLIGKLLAMGVSVVCVDIYRDRPVPPGNAALKSRLRDEARVVGALKYPDAGDAGIAAPPSITDPARRGFTDVAPDPDGTI
ncbi:MAG: CHASE2 domain-containing protein, partial [Hyphomicrobiales bacterium]